MPKSKKDDDDGKYEIFKGRIRTTNLWPSFRCWSTDQDPYFTSSATKIMVREKNSKFELRAEVEERFESPNLLFAFSSLSNNNH